MKFPERRRRRAYGDARLTARAQASVIGLALLYVLFGALPLAALAQLSLSLSDRAFRHDVQNNLVTTASVSSVVVRQRLEFLGQLVAGAAAAPGLLHGLEQTGTARRETLRGQADQLRTQQSGISEVLITDLTGHALVASPGTEFFSDFSHAEWFRAVLRHPQIYVSAAYTPNFPGAKRAITIAGPVRDARGRLKAILAAAYPLDGLQRFATQVALPQHTELLITDQTGVIVAQPGSDLSLITSVRDDPRIASALAGRADYRTVYDPTGPRLSATAPVPSTGWTVTASMNRDTALASLHRLRSASLGITGVLAAFLLLGLGLQVVLALKRARAEQRLADTARTLAVARDNAVTASENKSRLLATVSHEIRNPMNGVMGMTRLLAETELDDEQRRYVDAVNSSVAGLVTVVDDLLDLSRIEAGRLQIQPRPFNVRALCTDAVALFAPRAQAQGLALDVIVAPSVPTVLIGDAQRIRQVLVNLLTNAVKFTPAGAVSLQVDASPGPPHAVHDVTFTVADTGIGLTPHDQARVFDRFIRADQASGMDGAGLGLTITRELIALMSGRIKVDSVPGSGSRFRVCLPLTAPPPTRTEVYSARLVEAQPEAERTPGRVLVVEDDEVNRFVARRVLERGGFTVEVVADGAAAVRAACTYRYEAILMDLHLSGIDGIEVTRRIRAGRGVSATARVFAMTASVTSEDRDRCLDAGMNGFIAKPVDWEQLMRELRLHTSTSAPGRTDLPVAAEVGPARDNPSHEDGTSRNAPGEASSRDAPDWDEQMLADLANVGVLGEAVAAFRTSAPEVLSRFETACERREHELAAELAHRLTGAAGTVGALALSRVGRQVEDLLDRPLPDAVALGVILQRLRAALDAAVEHLELLAGRPPEEEC